MHEPKASALSARDVTLLAESTNNPVMHCELNNLALLTDLRQTSTRLGVIWKCAYTEVCTKPFRVQSSDRFGESDSLKVK